ncbi:MAG: hypothetical protein AB7S26_19605 [Sandaracinaceae bacterium]
MRMTCRLKAWVAGACLALLGGCGGEESSTPTFDNEGVVATGDNASLDDWLGPGSGGSGAASPHENVDPMAGMGPHGMGADPHAGVDPSGGEPPGEDVLTVEGTIRERLDAAGFTYFRVETSAGDAWIATMSPTVDVGAEITAAGTMMHDFRSNALNRTFPSLLLTASVSSGDGAPPSPHGTLPPGHGSTGEGPPGQTGLHAPNPHAPNPHAGGDPHAPADPHGGAPPASPHQGMPNPHGASPH